MNFCNCPNCQTDNCPNAGSFTLDQVMAAVARVESFYPTDIFPHPVPDSPVDGFTAAGARLACRLIRRELLPEPKLSDIQAFMEQTTAVKG